MSKYKYQISEKTDQEIWVCEACKKGRNQLILTGKWKLVDRCSDEEIQCSLCKENRAATAKSSAAAKKGTCHPWLYSRGTPAYRTVVRLGRGRHHRGGYFRGKVRGLIQKDDLINEKNKSFAAITIESQKKLKFLWNLSILLLIWKHRLPKLRGVTYKGLRLWG